VKRDDKVQLRARNWSGRRLYLAVGVAPEGGGWTWLVATDPDAGADRVSVPLESGADVELKSAVEINGLASGVWGLVRFVSLEPRRVKELEALDADAIRHSYPKLQVSWSSFDLE
jgi:hypothetical protein